MKIKGKVSSIEFVISGCILIIVLKRFSKIIVFSFLPSRSNVFVVFDLKIADNVRSRCWEDGPAFASARLPIGLPESKSQTLSLWCLLEH